jgi:hypothetical protein
MTGEQRASRAYRILCDGRAAIPFSRTSGSAEVKRFDPRVTNSFSPATSQTRRAQQQARDRYHLANASIQRLIDRLPVEGSERTKPAAQESNRMGQHARLMPGVRLRKNVLGPDYPRQ